MFAAIPDRSRAMEFTLSFYFLYSTCDSFLAKCDSAVVGRQSAELMLLLDKQYAGLDLTI